MWLCAERRGNGRGCYINEKASLDSSALSSAQSPRGERRVVCFGSPMQTGLTERKRSLTKAGRVGLEFGTGNNEGHVMSTANWWGTRGVGG